MVQQGFFDGLRLTQPHQSSGFDANCNTITDSMWLLPPLSPPTTSATKAGTGDRLRSSPYLYGSYQDQLNIPLTASPHFACGCKVNCLCPGVYKPIAGHTHMHETYAHHVYSNLTPSFRWFECANPQKQDNSGLFPGRWAVKIIPPESFEETEEFIGDQNEIFSLRLQAHHYGLLFRVQEKKPATNCQQHKGAIIF